MPRGTYPRDLAKALVTAFALVAGLAVAFGCGDSQQGSEAGENSSGSSISTSTPPPSTPQPPSRGAQEQASQERYVGLEVGEPAEFENGLSVTVEGASLMEVPEALREQLEPDDRLVAVRFSVENVNLEGQVPLRSFNVTTALWQARDQNDAPLQTLYPVETSLVAGELRNPSPDYPYMDWQGELRPSQKRQGSMLFAALPSTKMRVRFTQPVMGPPPFGEWKLGTVADLPQAL